MAIPKRRDSESDFFLICEFRIPSFRNSQIKWIIFHRCRTMPKNPFFQVYLVRPSKWQKPCFTNCKLTSTCKVPHASLSWSCLNKRLARTCNFLLLARSYQVQLQEWILGWRLKTFKEFLNLLQLKFCSKTL